MSIGTSSGKRTSSPCWRNDLAGLLGALLALLAAAAARAEDLPLVFVSIPPQLESVRAVGAGVCRAEALLRRGQSPEMFQANARMLDSLRRSSLFVGLGLPFERIVVARIRRSCPGLEVVDAASGMRFRRMDGSLLEPGAPPELRRLADPHVWLGVENMLVHAEAVGAALAGRFPGSAQRIRGNLASYLERLRRLQAELRGRLAGCRGRQVLVYHPAFGYFLAEHGLVQRPVELDGKSPGGRYLEMLLEEVRGGGFPVLFYQPQFSSRAAAGICRRLGLKLQPLDPLPERYSEGLLEMADAIAAACR